jgi:hypothetical protein
MPNTNITKIAAFVIFLLASSIISTGCGLLPSGRAATDDERASGPYERPVVAGKLESADLREASGIAASKCQPDVFWVQNDSGDQALIYAIDSKGKHLGAWKVAGANNRDWEDIATVKNGDRCYVLVGEIGDNERKHERIAVFRVEEPTVTPENAASSSKEPLTTAEAAVSYINYPNERHDAEALLAHPTSGEVYLVTKSNNSPSHIYKFKPRFEGETQALERVGEVAVPAIPNGSVTGGDISSDGKRLILCDYFAGYELALPEGSKDFDDVWKVRPVRVDLGKRELGEAVAYSADGSFVIAVSEKRYTPVNVAKRKAAN